MIRKQEITTFDFPQDAVIWDVRDNSAFLEGHVKGAVNLPITELNEAVLAKVATDQPIYLLCGGGSKAPRAAEKLEGFDASREYVILMGGTRAVKDAGLPLE
ncbi:rhodanese-like domain-containing protein [Acinetobacter sp. HY1485]|uniref:rhodanese-like domain-containing protein n=1 Tax=Acinetobacter sp. HY1485 TaxID=2970918 RepID=UPI0022B96490|nr:rhodanese-like domain-containing protein [Acinetobacter sp. HY1485]